MKRQLSLLAFLLCATLYTLNAQTASLTPSLVKADVLTEKTANDWSVYADAENKLYYIDFQAINVNLNDIIVKNEAGAVVYKDHVLDLPVDVIYELDLSSYPVGTYSIELRSFTSIIKKEVEVE